MNSSRSIKATGDERAVAKLLRRYDRFLRVEAGRATRLYRVDFDGAKQVAGLVLLHAVERYQPETSILESYARRGIRWRLATMVADRDAVTMPSNWLLDIQAVNKAIRALRDEGRGRSRIYIAACPFASPDRTMLHHWLRRSERSNAPKPSNG